MVDNENRSGEGKEPGRDAGRDRGRAAEAELRRLRTPAARRPAERVGAERGMDRLTDRGTGRSGPRRVVELKQVLREVRIATAERHDILVGSRDADQARLELLADALDGVFQDVPEDFEQLLLGLLPGHPPRFWVDATSFVVMGRDKRQYQFVKDTRIGRTLLAESSSVEAIADAITRYVAERIVERERAIEGDWVAGLIGRSDRVPMNVGASAFAVTLADLLRRPLAWGVGGFAAGLVAGMALLLAYAWFTLA